MNDDPVDILMATYNGSPYISQQIDSILEQSHGQIRLIIRDDGSTDETVKILENYAQRHASKVTLLPHDRRLGIKGNFSRLMQHATSKYIMFADQDDVWEKEKVETTLEIMKELEASRSSESPLLVHTDLSVVDGNLTVLSPSFWKYTHMNLLKGQTLNRLLMQNVVTGCATMINLPLLKLAYPIPEKAVMHDWWVALVASACGTMAALQEPTIKYRQHGKNSLGAKKFLSLRYIEQGVRKLVLDEPEKKFQASELYRRYADRMTMKQREMLKTYLMLSQVSFLKKAVLIFKYRFFKMGLLRNLASILFNKH